jgi:hypothetical protein
MPFDPFPGETCPLQFLGTISRLIVEVCDPLGERLPVSAARKDAIGTKQTSDNVHSMSTIGATADMRGIVLRALIIEAAKTGA